jgi:predicted acyltransferase
MTKALAEEEVDRISETRQPGERVMSVDVLRGFDMFWIIGADSLAYALHRTAQKPATQFFARQLDHAEWAGFHFYDLIFPLFIFIVGVSLVFSLSRSAEAGRLAAIKRIARRSIVLFLLGIIYSGGITNPWPDIRLLGVLNRIALVYFFASLLFLFLKPRVLAAFSIALLGAYWALLTFVPIRDVQLTKEALARQAQLQRDPDAARVLNASGNFSAVRNSPAWSAARSLYFGSDQWVRGKFDKGHNLSDHFDFKYLPGRKYDIFFDPEGLLSTLSAIATCLLGVFAGLLLRSRVPGKRKVAYLICFGVAASAFGWLWNFQIPVIKKIWTPSFTLVAGGYSAILLGFFYLVVDVWQARKWCRPFLWIGMNSITVYMISNLLGGFRRPAARLAGGDLSALLSARVVQGFGDVLISVVGLLLAFWLVYFLFKKKVFLRI